MDDPVGEGLMPEDDPGDAPQYYKRDFWGKENLKFVEPHYRLRKCAQIINRIARGKECDLLDVGCGPATLARLLRGNIHYHGIDIAIHDPAPNLLEADFLETPIGFHDKQFDIVVAQGVFEYVGDFQSRKFAEIARILVRNGFFISSYVNFGHRKRKIYPVSSNVQPIDEFRKDLTRHFAVRRFFPTAHNWNHGEPNNRLVQIASMRMNMNVPFVSPMLAAEYFFICSSSS